MKNMTIENIAKACEGKIFGLTQPADREAKNIDIDSRKIGDGDVFIAIKGERSDGHSYINEVLQKGALCAIGEQDPEKFCGPYIKVDSTLKALRDLAEFYLQQLNVKKVGITGSVGKTSTKEMISSVLSQHFCVHKTAGNFNNEIGLPLTVFGIRDEHQVAVLEMGISDFGEMHRLAQIAKPDIMVITNIGLCHLEKLKSRDGIMKGKTECLDHMAAGSIAVLNGDDDKLITLKSHPEIRKAYYSKESQDVAIYADEIGDKGLDGMDFTLHVNGRQIKVHEPLPGEHNISNALAAAAVATELGMSLEEIQAGIQAASTIGGRSNFIKTKGMTIIDDCYNANPVSMKASIEVLAKASGRKIAVLGDMGELGEDEKELHYGVGLYAAEANISALFTAGDLSKEIVRAMDDKASKIERKAFDRKDDLVEFLKGYVKAEDTILVKASHFMNFTDIVKALQE